MNARILIEGMMPYRALNRLQREGICIKNAKKRKKNQIICVIDAKDCEKVFAIYPNVCYNNGKYTPYTVRLLPAFGWQRLWLAVKNRLGLFVGAALFVAMTVYSDRLILDVEVAGEAAYAESVTGILAKNGVKKWGRYPEEKTDWLTAEILRLDGVGFCSIKKVGSTLVVDVRSAPFAESERTGDGPR